MDLVVPAAVQSVFVTGALGVAGVTKLFGRHTATAAHRSALRRLVGERRALPAYRLVGAVELALVVALLVPAGHPLTAVATTVWCLAMLAYLGYARLAAPGTSCGCLGSRTAPVGARAFARAGLLTAAAGLIATVNLTATGLGTAALAVPWPVALAAHPVPAVALLAVEAAVFVALSAELDHRWLLPLRRLRVRLRHPLGRAVTADPTDVPVQATLQQLYRSPAYRSAHGLLRSSVLDTWDEEGWRIVTFAAGEGTAVFAVPRGEHAPEKVRAVLVS
ncbi:hypothetical protein SAMN05421810_101620 [Amycolatopsis arida]|uniref:Methylamine utilisation protein MauE domain-containing protein n=1 Tax=Amycolatopsis arida TaxID=587909 RepID=A0A1I5LPN0_9PSEU|nr:MauE/DoxX family redox-associated membrane protein [Amycolatopsis arida]TDX93797.1 hypothetical protein CLV69_104253 [Amycolatopsis arida]SFO99319.1 hypothetical protein SAMN05421810_101620 [Amycolatopsis arida]